MEQQLTLGQQYVGLTFNPSGSEEVNKLKQQYADLIDYHNDKVVAEQAKEKPDGEVIRLHKIAITDLQHVQMMSVKAATWAIAPGPDASQTQDSDAAGTSGSANAGTASGV